jgi:hypothetical protein
MSCQRCSVLHRSDTATADFDTATADLYDCVNCAFVAFVRAFVFVAILLLGGTTTY